MPKLRYKADRRTIGFVGTYFILVAIGFTMSPNAHWGFYVLLTVLLSLLSFFCAVITHNTVHVPVFMKKEHNHLFQSVLTLTYGHPVSMFVPGHNLSHHKYVQQERDLMRTDKMRFKWNLLNQLFFSAVVGPAIFKCNAIYATMMKRARPSWHKQFSKELWTYITFLLVTLGLSLWLDRSVFPGLRFLTFIMIPHQYAAWGIMGINFVQHDGCDANHPVNHSRNLIDPILNWFTFNNGYHGIHHMHPTLHWSLAPEAHAKEVAPFIHPNLEQRSFLLYLIRTYVIPGKRLNYDGTPYVLPPPRKDQDWIQDAVKFANPEDLGAIA